MTHRAGRLVTAVLSCLVLLLLASGPARAVIQGTTWFPIGPAPSCCFFPGGEAGRATSVAVNPANFNEIWIGTANGGLWRSTDGATTWQPMTDDQASLAIGSIALADCTSGGCDSVYAGTGENAIRRDTYYGRGLLVGRRAGPGGGGMAWTLRTGTPFNFGRGSIYEVVIDPTTGGTSRRIFVALSSGVTASASESTVTAPEVVVSSSGPVLYKSVVDYGLYKSDNDGVGWSKLTVEGATGDRPTDLEMDPTNHSVLYAGFLSRGLFKSTNNGASWCPLSPGLPVPPNCPVPSGLPDHAAVDFDHVEVAIDPANTQHLYASFGMCDDPLIEQCTPSVYESGNGGLTWSLRYQGGPVIVDSIDCPAAYSRYTHALTVYPADAGTVYLSGIRLCKSTDHGATWAEADSNALGRTTHLDHHGVVFDAVGFRGYDVNDGGIATWVYPSPDWVPRNQGIQAIAFQGIAVSPQTSRILGGTQDNGGTLWTGAKQWNNVPCCGDGGFSVMDEDDPMKMFITTNTGGLANLTVVPMRSTSGGAFFSEASNGIPDGEPRSFYPPMLQVGNPASLQNTLYFATNRLWRSTDDGSSWTAVSPVLSTGSQPEIVFGQDVISAVAVAPSDPTRIYIGYYSGKVFATDGACDLASCWYELDFGLPQAPITSIAVSPVNKDNVYATLSGFFSGGHVYGRSGILFSWLPAGSIAELSGVPANWIAVEPGAPQRLWLGTDKGLYKSTNSGGSWFKFGNGLPNAPVYQIAIDAPRQRVVAATHGRGAYLLTGPSLEAYGGCTNNFMADLTVWGTGFDPLHFCTVRLLRQDASVCASGQIDPSGGTIETDKDGVLATWKIPDWADDPGVWGCLNGKCLGNVDVSKCNVPGNQLSTVEATCGTQVAFAHISGCPTLSAPPSSWLSLTGMWGGFLGGGASLGGPATAAEGAEIDAIDPKPPTGGSFTLVPTLQSNDGTTRKLCAVNVPYAAGDTMEAILAHARDAVNADPSCLTAGVSAVLREAALESEVEDLFEHPGNLVLLAPTLTGSQLVPSVQKQPGPVQDPCFEFGALGVPVQNQLRLMRLGLQTGAAGAAGGSLTIMESSPLGECTVSVPTSPGQSADSIATAAEMVFKNPGPIGCPATANPHDVKKVAGGLILVMSTGARICVNDPGVGMTMAPMETCFGNADCDDANPCTDDVCDTATGQCQHPPVPDGTVCDDQNACTTGGSCRTGICGRPVVCADTNPCTEDSCDPATGACLHPPLQCDDGNPCTIDTCAATGACVFTPTPNAPCDDGNVCTHGDFCDAPPGGGTPICHGTDPCDDGNLCTADACDPATGACSNQPIQCDDGNPCTTDTCAAATGACVFTPTPNAPCDDADLCTQDDHCVQIAGGGAISCQGTPRTCNDSSLCTTDSCDPQTGQCVFAAKQCDDGQGCTDDVCVATTGQCSHPPRTCDDANPCTSDSCDPQTCVVPDDGGGTADLLPASCGYGSVDDLAILNGLPPGTAIAIAVSASPFTCPPATPSICSFPSPNPGVDCSQGTPAAGEQDCGAATFSLHLVGSGTLSGFVRDLPLAIQTEAHFDPRVPGAPVQSFDTDLFRLYGQLPAGDPDFSLLRITAGSDFGLPSPGHTTLTQSGGNWNVDSFFDMTYRIDYIGAPSSPLAGRSGSTTGTARIRTGAGTCVHVPVNCDDQDACTLDACDPAVGACTHGPVSCDDNDACTADSCDPVAGCRHQPITPGEPSPATFQSQFQVVWPASPNATQWNTYRGTIPSNMLGSRPAASRYDQTCFESANAFGDGPTLTTDDTNPPIGRAFYYLVSGEGPCGESPIGHDSQGTANPNNAPCPTPP
jgi:hypothetical protein